MCPSTSFDTARARLVGPDEFPRFLVPDVGEALAGAGLGPDVELWDHITGEAVLGPRAGRRLDVWPLHYTTVAAALRDDPSLTVSRRPVAGARDSALRFIKRRILSSRGFLPPPFRRTMAEVDNGRTDRGRCSS